MLPATNRLRSGVSIKGTVRHGRRAGAGSVVVHFRDDLSSTPTRVAFVVGKSVGNSVVRHRVQRRLRHVVSARLAQLPAGSELVIRAQPSAADASSRELAGDLDRALARVGCRGVTE